jgi:penicillin-binding protein 1A
VKYFYLTITFIIVVSFLVFGSIFYSSYNYWNINRENIFKRLHDLKRLIEQNEKEVLLTPDFKKNRRSLIYDRNLKVIGSISPGSRKIYSPNDFTSPMLKALLIVEDPAFYSRRVSQYRIIKILSIIVQRKTITGQISDMLLPKDEKKIKGYIIRILCTFELEERFSRNDILIFYINSVYFGHNLYGIENSARFYFNKQTDDLNLYEAALLFSIIKNPRQFSPLLYPESCKKRHKIVLNKLARDGIIDDGDVTKGFEAIWNQFPKVRHPYDITGFHIDNNLAPYFIEYVRQVLREKTGRELFNTGGLKIFTTLDIEKQIIARESLVNGLIRQGRVTADVTGSKDTNVEGAILVMDPVNGQIQAMVGGSGYTLDNQFNRAVSARRQIGSAFKPFVYAAAFETLNVSKDTIFIDRPLEIQTDEGIWRPDNYNGEYYGKVSLAYAMKKSLNSVAVQLGQDTGFEPIVDLVCSTLEIEPEKADRRFKPFPSAALGVYSFSPLEMARAYSIFPNGGINIVPVSILRVENGDGKVIISNDHVKGKRIIKKSTSSVINEILEGVLQEGGTAYEAVVSSDYRRNMSQTPIPHWMGKTGTTNDYTDAWFIGYDDTIIAAVWVGFDDPSNSLGEGQSGGAVAAPIWVDFMNKLLIAGH